MKLTKSGVTRSIKILLQLYYICVTFLVILTPGLKLFHFKHSKIFIVFMGK
jgi:hypothetical protein